MGRSWGALSRWARLARTVVSHCSLLCHTCLVRGFSADLLVSISGFHLPVLKGFSVAPMTLCPYDFFVCSLFSPCMPPLAFLPSCIWLSLIPFSSLLFHMSHIPCYQMWEVQTLRPSFQLSFPWSLIMKPCLISYWISNFFFFFKATALWNLGLNLGSHVTFWRSGLIGILLKQTFSISSCIWGWVWNRAGFSEDLSSPDIQWFGDPWVCALPVGFRDVLDSQLEWFDFLIPNNCCSNTF